MGWAAQGEGSCSVLGIPGSAGPIHARVFAACVVGYALSPIHLITDPIPVLGYLHDLVLVPLGKALAIRMIPAPVLTECRERAHRIAKEKPTNRVAAAVIVVVWLSLAALAIFLTMCAIWTLGWR